MDSVHNTWEKIEIYRLVRYHVTLRYKYLSNLEIIKSKNSGVNLLSSA
jgi:hypothetical protein